MTAVVTGASRGIGRATALELGRRGTAVCLLGRPGVSLDRAAEETRKLGVRAEAMACDLRVPEEVARAGSEIVERFGPPEVIVHNAGVVKRVPIDRMTDAEWNEQVDVNLRAPFLLTRALLPAMRRAGKGRILFVSSITGTMGAAGAAAYAASKWGLIGLMKSLAEEISGSGLMTVAILPGSVDTEMLEGSAFEPKMTPAEVAGTIAHYALDASLAHNGGVVEMFGT